MISPDNHLVFSHTIEVLFRQTLLPLMTPAIEARLRDVGLNLAKPLDPAYPLRVFDDAMEVVAVHALSTSSKTDALRRIGEMQAESFTQTFIGKATFQLARLLSRERLMKRMTHTWRQANNFIESTVTPQDDGGLKVHINDVGRFPEVIQGIQLAALKAAGHKGTVEIGARDGLGCEYLLRFL